MKNKPSLTSSSDHDLSVDHPYALVLTAAGSSTRMGNGLKKECLPMQDGTVLSSALKPFLLQMQQNRQDKNAGLTHIIITHPEGLEDELKAALYASETVRDLLQKLDVTVTFTQGGNTRQASVFNALTALESLPVQPEMVLIHDAARPWVSEAVIGAVRQAAVLHGAAVPAVPATDTMAQVNLDDGSITGYVDRARTYSLQTPQGFRFRELLDAHRKAAALHNSACTDDTTVWAAYCGPVHICEGSPANRKITFKEDIQKETPMQIRTGLGYDLHRLVPGRKLVLGGVEFPFDKGEDGHSDGDVLLHAITDALLGAAGIADIGELFPPSDAAWKDADSGKLLLAAWKKVTDEGWCLENLDCVIALEKPKFLPRRAEVRASIATLLSVPEDRIFVKAKTGEGTGEVGRGEVAAVWATCLISRSARSNQE